jgi:SAM-dependent methyltransferase
MRLDKVVQSDINTIQWTSVFSRGEFDCLIFADVLEHLYDPWERLRSACHHVRPGGTVIVSVPNIRHISALYRIFLRGQFPRNARGLFDGTHLRWFTLSGAASLVEQAGLVLERSIFNLRLRDQGGGRMNRLAIRLLMPLLGFDPIREFFTYQVCMRARKPQG